jgi:hypothetical protein
MMLGAVAALAWPGARGGVAGVLGAAVKVSSAALLPILVLGAHRRVRAVAGAIAAAVGCALVVAVVYGGHLPAIALQGRLVSPLSVPNLAGALAGLGGATPTVRLVAQIALAGAVAAGCVAVLRGGAVATVAGWVAVASILALPWVMPWYVLWVLPFAALSRSRALVLAAVALTVFLGASWLPETLTVVHSLGFKPTRTPIGRINHAYTESLLH